MSRTYPSTYEAPVFRLLKYGFIIWLSGVLAGVAIMLVAYQTNWWQQLGTATLQFHLVNPWFFLIYAGFGTVAVLYYYQERKKRIYQKKHRKWLEEKGFVVLEKERK